MTGGLTLVEQSGGLTREGVVERAPVERLAEVLGRDVPRQVLPPMWHAVVLLDQWSRGELGVDGHAEHGIPTPPPEPHRRMFAGGRAVHLRPLHLDRAVRRTSTVTTVTHKEGRTGPLAFVTVRHEVEQDGSVAVVDEHDLVYRPLAMDEAPVQVRPPESGAEVLVDPVTFAVDPVTLFLFSAATANAHRIHYDLDFARNEGHPDLVVHGPLQVLLMADALTDAGADFAAHRFEYRLLAPAYGAQKLRIGRPSADDAAVVVVDELGRRVARGGWSR